MIYIYSTAGMSLDNAIIYTGMDIVAGILPVFLAVNSAISLTAGQSFSININVVK